VLRSEVAKICILEHFRAVLRPKWIAYGRGKEDGPIWSLEVPRRCWKDREMNFEGIWIRTQLKISNLIQPYPKPYPNQPYLILSYLPYLILIFCALIPDIF